MAKELEKISLRDIIPSSIANDKNVQAIITAIDPQFQEVSQNIREAFIISRINELPENVIDLLAWQWHVDFYEPELPIDTKRQLVLESLSWHRKKGTKSAIKSALEKLGFVPTIKEWFEPEMNTEPYTFSVRGYYKDDHINVDFLGEQTQEILTRIIELTKPARSKLLNLTIAPIPIDMTKHLCLWDVCNWEHTQLKIYDWGLLTPKPSIFETVPLIKRDFERNDFTLSDTAFWGINRWDCVPFRFLLTGQHSETGIICSLEWGDGDAAMLYPNLWDNSKWDFVSTFSRSFGQDFSRGFSVGFDLDTDRPQIFRPTVIHRFYCGTWPFWDCKTWAEHYSWGEEFEQQPVKLTTQTEFTASLDWNSKREEKYFFFDKDKWDFQEREKYNAPLPKWSNFKTWAGSDTWNTTTEQAGTWEVGTWKQED